MPHPEENVGILESNSFDMRNLDSLDDSLRPLVARRKYLAHAIASSIKSPFIS